MTAELLVPRDDPRGLDVEVDRARRRAEVVDDELEQLVDEYLSKNSGKSLLPYGLGVMPFEGGLPIIVGGKTLGAIGVSGGSAPQDGQVAKAAIDWLQAALK